MMPNKLNGTNCARYINSTVGLLLIYDCAALLGPDTTNHMTLGGVREFGLLALILLFLRWLQFLVGCCLLFGVVEDGCHMIASLLLAALLVAGFTGVNGIDYGYVVAGSRDANVMITSSGGLGWPWHGLLLVVVVGSMSAASRNGSGLQRRQDDMAQNVENELPI